MKILDYNLIERNLRCEPTVAFKYADTAEFYVQEIAGKTFDELKEEYDGIPGVFISASLLIVGSLVEFKEPNPFTCMVPPMSCFHLPYSIKALIWQYSKPGIDQRIENIENMLNRQKMEMYLAERKNAEKKLLMMEMEECHGDIAKAAEDLGYSESVLMQKLIEHGIK